MKLVYKIENTLTNDLYIGGTTNFQNRKDIHRFHLRRNSHKNSPLQTAWNQYGESKFVFSILEQLSEEDNLLQREQFYITSLNPAYNICKIAGSPEGIKHTEEARTNMSKAHLGKSLTVESIAKRTLKQKGLKRSVETVQNLRDSSRKIAVIQYNTEGIYIRDWISASEAGRQLNISPSHITSCCKGKKTTIGGFKWQYKTLQI